MTEQEALRKYLIVVPRVARDIKWIMGWDKTKTITQNCADLEIPNHPTGCNLQRKFKLGFKEGYHRVIRTNKESMEVLKKNGLTQSEISRLLGVSSERIRQIINKNK